MINALPTKTEPVTGDKVLLSGASEEYLIDYDKLATAILNKLTSKTFTLDQGTKTFVAALNELNSKTFKVVKFYQFDAPIDIEYRTAGTIEIEEAGTYLVCFNQIYNAVKPSGIKLVDGASRTIFYDEDNTDVNYFVGFSYFDPTTLTVQCKSIQVNAERTNGVRGVIMKIN